MEEACIAGGTEEDGGLAVPARDPLDNGVNCWVLYNGGGPPMMAC